MHAELHPFRLALTAPLVTGGVSVRFRAGLLVSLGADGLVGWGEASPLPGWSRTSLLDTEAALRRILDGIDANGEAGSTISSRACLTRRMPGRASPVPWLTSGPNEPGGRSRPISLEAGGATSRPR